MPLHIHAPSPKRDALYLQPQPLIQSRMPTQLDLSTRAKNPMPV